MTGIGSRLKAARLAYAADGGKELSQNALSRMAGVSASVINRLESGQATNASVAVISSIESALGLMAGSLMGPDPVTDTTDSSLDRFLESHYAKDLNLTDDEISRLRCTRWYTSDEVPTDADWFEFVRFRRRLQRR